jgi:hypothetical protein
MKFRSYLDAWLYARMNKIRRKPKRVSLYCWVL